MINILMQDSCCSYHRRNSIELISADIKEKETKCQLFKKTILQFDQEKRRTSYKFTQNIIVEIDHGCTLEQMDMLIDTGATAFYYNLANGSNHGENCKMLWKFAQITDDKKPAIILGICGRLPKTGRMYHDKEVNLKSRKKIILTADRRIASRGSTSVAIYANAYDYIMISNPGDIIRIGTEIKLFVLKHVNKSLVCIVKRPGKLGPNQSVVFPCLVNENCVTHEELQDLEMAFRHNIDILCVPEAGYYNYAVTLRKIIDIRGKYVMLLAHISKNDVKSIADAKLLNKAYCGIICKLENISDPSITERQVIEHFYESKKPVIIQVENFDYLKKIANISIEKLFYLHYYPDGFCIKKSKQIDKYYVNFKKDLEEHYNLLTDLSIRKHSFPVTDISLSVSNLLFRNVAIASHQLYAKIMFIITHSGRSAISLSHWRPVCIILAITSNKFVADKLTLFRNIRVYLTNDFNHEVLHEPGWKQQQREKINAAIKWALKMKYCQVSDTAIFLLKTKRGLSSCDYVETVRYLKKSFDSILEGERLCL